MGLREINERRTRALIEGTARSLFCSKGIGGTDLKEIAEASGIPRTTLYTYYRDKDALAAALYLTNLETMLAHLDPVQLQKRMKACKGDLKAVITRTFEALVANFVKDPDAYLYDFAYNLHAAQGGADPTDLRGYPTEQAPGLAMFHGLLEEGIRTGIIKGCPTAMDFLKLVAFPLVAYLVRLAVFERQKAKPDFAEAGRTATAFKALLLEAVLSPSQD